MNVPADILESLKCSKCEVYLSRGPIYLQHDGAAACGRCFTSKNPATRNTQYEALAQLARFPCKNRDLGCPVTVLFAEEDEDVAHEEVCEYRQYVCPVLGSARCDWLGTRGEMLQHCQEQHPDRVLDNPCSLVHNITKSNLHNYLVTAFQLLFLLHTKVCVTTGKIFHAVRFLGASEKVPEFDYTLGIKRKNEFFMKEGQVVGQGCLAIQEDTSLALSTNSLLDMFGGGDGISFTLTIKHLTITLDTCEECNAQLTSLKYNINGWHCDNCVPTKRFCINEGCNYRDLCLKCTKHEVNFCNKSKVCELCDLPIPKGTLFAHYTSAHSDITYRTGSKWRITPQRDWKQVILKSIAGTVNCWYKFERSVFTLAVLTLIKSGLLHEYTCTVRVTQPSTGLEIKLTPDASYNSDCDWYIKVPKEKFSAWVDELDVIVDLKHKP